MVSSITSLPTDCTNARDDYIEHRKADYEAVELEDLAQALSARISADDLIWFISGDLAKIEEGLAALDIGDIEVWNVDGEKVR